MSEHNETGMAGQQAAGMPSSSSVGRELARLREARGWSQEFVSERLKFALRQVRALESEQWDELPQGMSLRGFVRNYARLLEIDPAPLQAMLPALKVADPVSLEQASSLSSPLAQSSSRGWPVSSGRKRVAPWLMGGLMAVAALALLGYALNEQGRLSFGGLSADAEREGFVVQGEPPVAAEVFSEPAPQAPETAPVPDAAASMPESPSAPPADPVPGAEAGPQAAAPLPASPDAAATPLVAPASPPAASGAPAADGSAPEQAGQGIAMTFKEASWIEVRRADGSVAASRIIPANEHYALDAAGAPYRVVIGNVKGVALTWRGAPVDLSNYPDNVARLTLN